MSKKSFLEDLLKKCEKIDKSDMVHIHGFYIISRRKLHESGYRLLYVIGHDENFEKYYLLSDGVADVVQIREYYFKHYFEESKGAQVGIDVNKDGVIHVWTLGKKDLISNPDKIAINVSTCEIYSGQDSFSKNDDYVSTLK